MGYFVKAPGTTGKWEFKPTGQETVAELANAHKSITALNRQDPQLTLPKYEYTPHQARAREDYQNGARQGAPSASYYAGNTYNPPTYGSYLPYEGIDAKRWPKTFMTLLLLHSQPTWHTEGKWVDKPFKSFKSTEPLEPTKEVDYGDE